MRTLEQTTYTISAGDYKFSFLSSGDICKASYKSIMINQLISNAIDGSLNNLYLRVHHKGEINAYPLLGVRSSSEVAFGRNHVIWTGIVEGISYKVTFYLTEQGIWFWDVNVKGQDKEIDIIYGQDIGIADESALRNNEAYISQYIDHKVFGDKQSGYVVCSRQNQQQSTGFPFLQQGSFSKLVGFSTDGFQYFGKAYKETDQPEVLTKAMLANEVYQYEFAYIALQSERKVLNGNEDFVFYGMFIENHESAVTELCQRNVIQDAWKQVEKVATQSTVVVNKIKPIKSMTGVLQTKELTVDELNQLYPNRHQEEWNGDTLLSFFTETYEHIVLKQKELLVERPHGHIMMSGNNDRLKENTITSTSWMYGVFNSHIVIGNTNFNKMLTNTRNPLNISKTSGQRIYVEIDGTYLLLTLPSAYEIGFNYSRWYYKTDQDTFVITSYTTVDTPEVHLHVKATSDKAYRFLVTNQLVMHTNEYEVLYHIEHVEQGIKIMADERSANVEIYPELTYKMIIEGAKFTYTDEQKLVTNIQPGDASLAVFKLESTPEWRITVQGSLNGEDIPVERRDAETEINKYREYYREVMNDFQLSQQGDLTEELNKVNALAWWYTHNMLVHFSVPHGLEQYSGAAWGTRDVCQGPTEYFMATQNYDSVREIIKTVYSHQFKEDGNWPQWFMFDKYSHIQADESHGDIIVWPLKVIGDYLEATRDYTILNEKVPYIERENSFRFTIKTETIYEHIKKQLNYIDNHFLYDTYLSSYGDGDWDDTLQPANDQLKQYMVSTWTVSLTYEVIAKYARVLEGVQSVDAAELALIASKIEQDFNKYMLQTDVLPGFLYMEQGVQPEMMLHPDDKKTGIHYRLLPMQQSIISELLTPEQAENHYQLIKEKLYCPDGVRLMNRPANYTGGVNKHFKRAELAANFGREIGLQYVHAHIRFVEAMAKLGKKEEVWKGLQMINPIRIQDVVPNAEIRQSNAYFSSSDGKFNTRYDAAENFDLLRNGSVAVKGGWRIYSSGPGIYMNQLISNWLGIRTEEEDLIIDPMLTDSFEGLTFNFLYNGRNVQFVYHLDQADKRIEINGQQVNNVQTVKNRYRDSGFRISKKDVDANFNQELNIVEIYL